MRDRNMDVIPAMTILLEHSLAYPEGDWRGERFKPPCHWIVFGKYTVQALLLWWLNPTLTTVKREKLYTITNFLLGFSFWGTYLDPRARPPPLLYNSLYVCKSNRTPSGSFCTSPSPLLIHTLFLLFLFCVMLDAENHCFCWLKINVFSCTDSIFHLHITCGTPNVVLLCTTFCAKTKDTRVYQLLQALLRIFYFALSTFTLYCYYYIQYELQTEKSPGHKCRVIEWSVCCCVRGNFSTV